MLLLAYEPQIAEISLVPSSGGRFEVTGDGMLLFSKQALGRHADPDEVVAAIKSKQPVSS